MYKTNVIVNLQVEGAHAWPGAPEIEPEVGFLSKTHRHVFHIKCVKSVCHDDRDVEIIKFKRDIQDYLKKSYWSTGNRMHMFDDMSCEMLSKELVQMFGLELCQVLEDGENGAETMKDQIKWRDVNFICGFPCSGKDTFIKSNYNRNEYNVVVVSDIVKRLAETHSLAELQDTAKFDLSIIEELKLEIDASGREDRKLVIDGIRQPSILRALNTYCKFQTYNTMNVWLEVPHDIREFRYNIRRRSSDDLEHSDVVKLNMKLGVGEVKDYIMKCDSKLIVNHWNRG